MRSSVTFSLADAAHAKGTFENLTLTGAGRINGTGNSAANVITGNTGNNILTGGNGKDTLNGAGGIDVLVGGAGRDTMTGAAGKDRFDFNNVAEIGRTSSTWDIVTDFTHNGDDLDLSTIDANGGLGGNGSFALLATKGAAFTGVAGQVRWFQSGGNTFVQGDTNGNKAADFQIQLNGIKILTAGDFIL